MAMVRKVEVDFSFSDQRGSLVQLVHEGFEQINVLCSHQGVFRGGHYHKESTERFYVVQGAVKLTAEQEQRQEEYLFETGDCFEIPPLVIHRMQFSQETILVAMYDKSVEKKDGAKDIIAE